MDINKSQVNIEHLNDLCTELKILSTDIIQTYLTNTLVGYNNAGPIIKQALFKLFRTKVYIVNEYQYIYIKYNIHKNDKFNIKFVMYLLGNIPNTTIGLAEKYLDLYCEKTDTAKILVQRWIPIVAAVELTRGNAEDEEFLKKWVDVVDYQ